MNSTSPSSKPRSIPVLKIILALSLTLNLVVAGLVAGAMFGRSSAPQREAAMTDFGIAPFVSALPGEVRRQMGDEIAARSGNLRENRRMLQEQFDTMLSLLRADDFQLERLRQITEAQDGKLRERQQIGRDLLFTQIGAMSAGERRAYADRLEDRLKRGKKNWPKERDTPRPDRGVQPPR